MRAAIRWHVRWRRMRLKRWTFEAIPRWIAFRLPKSLIYWATIRLIAHATTGQFGSQIVPELRAMDALERWGYDPIGVKVTTAD